jgi:hypothetical protein
VGCSKVAEAVDAISPGVRCRPLDWHAQPPRPTEFPEGPQKYAKRARSLLAVVAEQTQEKACQINAAALTGEGHDESRAARHADGAGEAEAEEPTREKAAEFVLYFLSVVSAGCRPGYIAKAMQTM